MSDSQEGNLRCLIVCILVGILAGFLGWYLLQPLMGLLASVPIGIFIALFTAWMLHEAFCEEGTETRKLTDAPTSGQTKASPAAASFVSSTPKPKSSKSKSKSQTKSSSGPKLYTSRPDQVDDLKMIAGIGPKLEGVLHQVGVYQFKQIADWKKKDIAYVDERLMFKGRIDREEWVKQAKALAKGGEAEYIKVFGKKPR